MNYNDKDAAYGPQFSEYLPWVMCYRRTGVCGSHPRETQVERKGTWSLIFL